MTTDTLKKQSATGSAAVFKTVLLVVTTLPVYASAVDLILQRRSCNQTSKEASLPDLVSDLADPSDEEKLRMWIAARFLPKHLPQLMRHSCLWGYVHEKFPAVFDRMWACVESRTYLDKLIEERSQISTALH